MFAATKYISMEYEHKLKTDFQLSLINSKRYFPVFNYINLKSRSIKTSFLRLRIIPFKNLK